MPRKYVGILQDGARTRVNSNVGLIDKMSVGIWLHQRSSLSPYMFALFIDVACGIEDLSPWCMLLADDMALCSTRKVEVEKKLEE